MKSVPYKTILNILLAGGLALGLTVLVVGGLVAAPQPAQANSAPEQPSWLSRVPPLITATSTITDPPAEDGPISVLELFSGPAVTAASEAELMGTAELEAAAVSSSLLGSSPTFSSDEMPAGTFSMDWGDVERDGDLDLAIGSTQGTAVYIFEDGAVDTFWSNSNYTLEVRWADVDNDDPNLELIAVGTSSGGNSPLGTGTNYVYVEPESSSSYYSFSSGAQLLRIAPGDYDGDGLIDLAVSTNALNPPTCPVLLYLNSGFPWWWWPPFWDLPLCVVSDKATASLSAADFGNDGDLDLALSRIQNQEFGVLENDGSADPFSSGAATFTPTVSSLAFPPNDAAWGDYNRDGDLDLALAFPLQREARIYRNTGSGFAAAKTLPSSFFLTPMTLDWADFNGDGSLDLAVAELPPKIYDGDSVFSTTLDALPVGSGAVPANARIRSLRGIDLDDDVDLDLALTNQFGPSLVFTTTAPFLSTRLTSVSSNAAESVAWGEITTSGYLDLLFGGELYEYQSGTGVFTDPTTVGSGGTHAAFGEMDSPPDALDVLLGTSTEYEIYSGNGDGTFAGLAAWDYSSDAGTKSLAWGYLNNDKRLDLLLGNDDDQANLVINGYPSLSDSSNPIWNSADTSETQDLAWGDYDGDGHFDYAAADGTDGVRLYHNNVDTSFSLSQTLAAADARSVAWADYDGDGDMDLAVGNYGDANQVYQNDGGTLAPAWQSQETYSTTAVAWGDWDNDGDFELAVGNDNQADQVYANLGGGNLQLLWQSQELSPTTAVAWGDKDGDGDLDLAVSQGSGGENGVYENFVNWPAHLTDFTEYMPLPRHPSYVSVARPGNVPDAYFFSSPELLGYRSTPYVTVTYKLFDPDGPGGPPNNARSGGGGTAGDDLASITFEYSLNGGTTWLAPTLQSSDYDGTTSRGGNDFEFLWDAQTDAAISDNARFRITIVHQKPTGPVQRASIRAVSPPFRVRGDDCNWPANPSITIPSPPPPYLTGSSNPITFLGNRESGTGSTYLSFAWDFGDGGETRTGQAVNKFYENAGTYTVVLKVTGLDCPSSQVVGIRKTIEVVEATTTGSELRVDSPYSVYLPLILKSGAGAPFTPAKTLAQVTGLHGTILPAQAGTHLEWTPSPAADALLGYRIYRASSTIARPTFQLLATVPPTVTTYVDQTTTCDQMYYVTAFNASGETDASTTSYFSPLCP